MKQAKLTKKNYNIIRFLILILALAAIGCIVFFRGIEGSKNTIDENEDMQNIDNNTFINFSNI